MAYGCMGLAEDGVFFTLALVPLSLMMVVPPALQSSLTRCVSASEQGRLQGSVASINCIAATLAPIVFGKVYSSAANGSIGEMRHGAAFLVAALMLLAAAVCAAATYQRVPEVN